MSNNYKLRVPTFCCTLFNKYALNKKNNYFLLATYTPVKIIAKPIICNNVTASL
jgi:hypothetical protein